MKMNSRSLGIMMLALLGGFWTTVIVSAEEVEKSKITISEEMPGCVPSGVM